MAGGSIGTVACTTLGDKAYSREQVEVFCDGSAGVIGDFRALRLMREGEEDKANVFAGEGIQRGAPPLRGIRDGFPVRFPRPNKDPEITFIL
jgi:hypothetical protein